MSKVGRKPRAREVMTLSVKIDALLWVDLRAYCDKFALSQVYVVERAVRNFLSGGSDRVIRDIKQICDDYLSD